MEVISVGFDGEPLVDVFAYRGFIYGWNFENELLIYSVDSLISQLRSIYGTRGLSAAYALFCSRGIGASAEMKEAFRKRDTSSQEMLRLTPEPLARATNIGRFKHVIDMRITYDRLYLATEIGLFIGSLNPRQVAEEQAITLDVEHEGECVAVNTGMRAVGASFGTAGLYVVTNEISELMGPRKSWLLPITSVRSSLGASTLANFPSQEEMQSIPVSVTQGKRGKVLSDLTITDPEAIDRHRVVSRGYLFWDARHRRMFDVAQQSGDENGRWFVPPVEVEGVAEAAVTTVISAGFTGNSSLAMETSGGTVVVRGGVETTIEERPTISMRTYRNSWRYRRLITITSTESASLHATLD